MKVNGIAHIYLTVQNFERCKPFYEKLLAFLDMHCMVDIDGLYYCIGSRTGIGIRAAGEEHRATAFDQGRVGFHHLCFRAYQRQDIDTLHDFLLEIGATVVHPPREDSWAPGYYSVLFEDPDGLRLEANHVPGRGNLEPGIELPISRESQQKLGQ